MVIVRQYVLLVFSFIISVNLVIACEESMIHLPTGRHVIADLEECTQCFYRDGIEEVLLQAARDAGATVLDIKIFPFDPISVNGTMQQGMTGTVILSESHIAFHTWPEYGFVACDIFTCGANALPEKGLDVLVEYFGCKKVHIKIIGRGLAAMNDLNLESNLIES